jgi:hypothetical protein
VILKSVAVSLLRVPIEFKHRILQSASFECHDRSASDKELMLYDTARLKYAGHQTEIGAPID